MSDPTTTPSDSSFASEKPNDLTLLADFMIERHSNEFELAVACEIGAIGIDHDRFETNCNVGHSGYDEWMPCDEWQRAHTLGIAWLKSRIVDLEQASASSSNSGVKRAPKRVGD